MILETLKQPSSWIVIGIFLCLVIILVTNVGKTLKLLCGMAIGAVVMACICTGTVIW